MLIFIIQSDHFVYGDFNSEPQFLIDNPHIYYYNSILDLRHESGQFIYMVQFYLIQFEKVYIDILVVSNFIHTRTKNLMWIHSNECFMQ